ncbi:hypothetical protein JAAARDRAFT_199586 [Jaapia argillacea MUCL 33604]|uniref:Fungal-type protein kinase domain-containing protein n=1 Tax=Jaapia argillacea MUCL 33604 TaxID=933084 RepID=A0A067P7K6_9AGAM|nr:hypothetical protein JAAARDRAFT_199586 [Jaapia argillacea MUCL 33604]
MSRNASRLAERDGPPVTPKKKPLVATQEALKSTPSMPTGTASAANSETQRDLIVPNVTPLLYEDLKNSQTCRFKTLLGVFLLRCQVDGDTQTAEELLKQCLHRILPICNQDAEIRKSLVEYCEIPGPEEDRYGPFVKTFNSALERTRTMEFTGLRPPSELDVMFHRNDPTTIQAVHDGAATVRVPDTLLVSTNSAHRANSDPIVNSDLKSTTREVVRHFAPDTFKGKFAWNDCLCAQEFKRRKKAARDLPPLVYSLHVKEVEPQKIAAEILSNIEEALDPDSTTDYQSIQNDAMPSTTEGASSIGSAATSSKMQPSKKRRPATQSQSSTSKKPKKESTKAPPLVQCASYGAEMLSRGVYTTHAINLFIVDNTAWVWWFDRQGAIQSQGVDFVQNLPYFLVLLAAFQRFRLQDWGINEELVHDLFLRSESPTSNSEIPPAPNDTARFPFKFPNHRVIIDPGDILHGHYSLLGRATRILMAYFASGEGDDLVVKIYWPEESRENEARIIKLATEAGKTDDLIGPHLPHLIDHRDIRYRTGQIREELGIETQGSRVLRVMLFEKLNHMDNLAGEEFMKIWMQCYRCHFRLWLNGIEHGDISLSNLMVRPSTGQGVVNDFDLAVLRKQNGDRTVSGSERTGTIPFMALDLLSKDYFAGKICRLYRHDCESFIWVMPWVLLAKTAREQQLLKSWATYDYEFSLDRRSRFLLRVRRLRLSPAGGNRAAWTAATKLFQWLRSKDEEAELAVESEDEGISDPIDTPETELHVPDHILERSTWQDPSEAAACQIFQEFELELRKKWIGFEVLPKDKTRPLSAEERVDFDKIDLSS